MSLNSIQLEMSFDERRNRLKERLDEGKFFVLIEVSPPARLSELDSLGARLSELEFAISSVQAFPTGLAFMDKTSPDSCNVAEFASRICGSGRDNHLVYISGRGASLEEMADTVNLCEASGFKNIVPVTGDAFPGESAAETRKRVFTEGLHLLKIIRDSGKSPLFPGCATNPFKYTPCDCFTQYFKMIKKLDMGANFIVTHFGWDMMKLQELRWYLTNRSLHYPSIARLLWLKPEQVDLVADGRFPGTPVSPDLLRILRNELKYSYKQFESAQLRRLQIFAAGCKLLGYSGVQIGGVDNADQAKIVCRKISSALDEFKNFQDWKKAYLEHNANSDMAPYPHRFYMFRNLFKQPHLDGAPFMHNATIPPCSRGERMNYKICKFMFANALSQPAGEHSFTKRLLAKCPGCTLCRLPSTNFVCPETCPKGVANGPCGGARADGSCEVGDFECIHSKRMRLSIWTNDVSSLEDGYIEFAERLK